MTIFKRVQTVIFFIHNGDVKKASKALKSTIILTGNMAKEQLDYSLRIYEQIGQNWDQSFKVNTVDMLPTGKNYKN